MKPSFLAIPLLFLSCAATRADTTIEPVESFAWAGSIGWTNWRPSISDGVRTGEYVCSGKIWAANVGWINVGNGTPANGVRYQNLDGADFGINLLPDGRLRGLAWGANIGWINFEATGDPRIDLGTGTFSGYAWAANAGWVTLNDGDTHFVSTQQIIQGADTDADGISDAWELEHAGDLTVLSIDGDADFDGISDVVEYASDSEPLDPADAGVRITSFTVSSDTALVTLEWTSRQSRRYHVEFTEDLLGTAWAESSLAEIAPDSGATTQRSIAEPAAARRFYRVRVARPLTP